MKPRLFLPLFAAGALVSCDSSAPDGDAAAPDEPAAPAAPAAEAPAAPDAGARAALEAQEVGGKLLGKTVRLSGDEFVPADPPFAPEAWFVYYSASW